MLVTVFFCFNSNLLCIDKNFQNELWVLQSSPVIEQLVKTGRMHNKSFQRKRWGVQRRAGGDQVPIGGEMPAIAKRC